VDELFRPGQEIREAKRRRRIGAKRFDIERAGIDVIEKRFDLRARLVSPELEYNGKIGECLTTRSQNASQWLSLSLGVHDVQ